MNRKQFALVAVAAAILTIVGALVLPYAVPAGGGQGMEGTDLPFEGVVTAIFAILGGAAAAAVALGVARVGPIDQRQLLFAGILAFGVALIVVLSDFFERLFEFAARGVGLWLALLGALAGVVACFLGTTKPRV